MIFMQKKNEKLPEALHTKVRNFIMIDLFFTRNVTPSIVATTGTQKQSDKPMALRLFSNVHWLD